MKMISVKFTRFFPAIIILFFLNNSFAQTPDDAADYLSAISNAHVEMNSRYMQYMSTTAHVLKQKNAESLRGQVLESISNSRQKTASLSPYKGDNSLRQISLNYIEVCYNIFNNDFGKLVNMHEIEEQSFNEMQETILIQEKAAEKLVDASLSVTRGVKEFSDKYNISLSDERTKLTEKLAVAARLNHYRNAVFLIFYKCNWEDNEINKAIEAKKLNDIEQGRNALIKYAIEGMQALDVMPNFDGDPSLKYTCRETLKFYKRLGEIEIPQLTDFNLAEENYNKIKKDFDSAPKHSQDDLNNYNAQVKYYNEAVNKYNQSNNFILDNRKNFLANWNGVERQFADAHMPHYRDKDATKPAKK